MDAARCLLARFSPRPFTILVEHNKEKEWKKKVIAYFRSAAAIGFEYISRDRSNLLAQLHNKSMGAIL